MSTTIRSATPTPTAPASDAARARVRRSTVVLVLVALGLVAAAVALGARAWHVGSGLGSALFPVDGIVELAAVATGAVVAGRAAGHAVVALGWVLACRRGVRWAAGERAVSRHAPAVVRRLARSAVGVGVGLALAAPTASALPDRGGDPAGTDGPAAAVSLAWRTTGGATADRADAARADRPERSALVDRGLPGGGERRPVVVVEPGDTLWDLAADGLADANPSVTDPPDAEIAAAVERWHHVNRAVLGDDPDLLLPGMVLYRP